MTITTPGIDALHEADDIELADRLKRGRDQILAELRKLIVGQDAVIEQALIALFAGARSCRRRSGRRTDSCRLACPDREARLAIA